MSFLSAGERRLSWPEEHEAICHSNLLKVASSKGKGKGFPYSIPSVGPGADPGVQAVSLQVTVSHPPGGRLPFPSCRASLPFAWYQVILLGDRVT